MRTQVPHATTSSTRWKSPQAGRQRTADGPSDASLGPSSCLSCFPCSSAVSSFCFPFALCSMPCTRCATNVVATSLLAPINPCRNEKISIRKRVPGFLRFYSLPGGHWRDRECRNTSWTWRSWEETRLECEHGWLLVFEEPTQKRKEKKRKIHEIAFSKAKNQHLS